MLPTPFVVDEKEFLPRPRVQALLESAAKEPLAIVCAGAGYGKSRAVFEFARKTSKPAFWIHFSERDNAGSRFWAKYTRFAAGWDEDFARQCKSMGFPDTEDKLNQYWALRARHAPERPHLFVLDDIHLIRHPDILRFMQRRLRESAKNSTLILVCRELPALGLAGPWLRGQIPSIGEDELRFTEEELALYLAQQGVPMPAQSLRDILADTGGWAFSVSLVARSLKKSPGYAGYVRVAMKQNIFRLMESEVFDVVSERLQRFMVRLSLIDHLPAELVATLAGGDAGLLAELRRQSAYIRFDDGIHAYLIHHLFLDYLRTRRSILTKEETAETYRLAAAWCRQNGFEIDALGYLEKMEDYGSLVALMAELPMQMPMDIARCAVEIFERAPRRISGEVFFFAAMHVRVAVRLGRWQEALALMRSYEEEFLRLPEDDDFRNRALGTIYYSWGNLRALLCTMDDRYDFDSYYAKMDECLSKSPLPPEQCADVPIGAWVNLTGSARAGAPQEFINAYERAARHFSHCWGGWSVAADVLCRGELLYYRGEIRAAEPIFTAVLGQAPEQLQFEIEHKTLFYLLRLALWHGDHEKAQRVLRRMETRLESESYSQRFFHHDIALGWYYCALRQPEKVPLWLRESFAPYSHAYFAENFGNQLKARYRYLVRDYAPLLAYIESVERRESILYGRVEMLALKACVCYQMQDKPAALNALRQAYETGQPNGIIMPFVELGRDMRTLAFAALREPGTPLPTEWLETVKRKAATFAKHQSLMVSACRQEDGPSGGMTLSTREREILGDLYHGLTRPEIAAKQALSTNTVNSAVNSIFNKLGAHSIADAVRIAAEEKLV